MKAQFRTASLLDLKLPPQLKEKLWRSGLVHNAPALHVLSVLSTSFISTEQEANSIIDEMLDMDRLIKEYSGSFFYYRKGVPPEEAIYAAMARTTIAMAPELFPNLPQDYHSLADQLETIDCRPESINDIRISPQAKFCHLIELTRDLKTFRHSLRSGRLATDSDTTQTSYNKIVAHAKNDLQAGLGIIEDIRKMTQDIDFIFNHYNDEFAWFIETGIREGERIFSNDFLFAETEIPDIGRSREVFNAAYNYYKAKHLDGYSAYYEFSEKVLSPLSIFLTNFSGISETSLIYALSKPVIDEGSQIVAPVNTLNDNQASDSIDEYFPGGKISITSVRTYACARGLSELVYHTIKMWGSAHQPFVFVNQVPERLEKLEATENLPYRGLTLENYMQKYRGMAADTYNNIAKANESLGFQHYKAPDLPPAP